MLLDLGEIQRRAGPVRQRRGEEGGFPETFGRLFDQLFDTSRNVFANIRMKRGGFRIIEFRNWLILERNRRELRYSRHNFFGPYGLVMSLPDTFALNYAEADR